MVDERLPFVKDQLRKQRSDLAEKTLNNYAACLLVVFKALFGQSFPLHDLEFVREKRPEIEMFVSHSGRFTVASHPIYYSSLILASRCLGDKSLEEEYRHLNNLAVAEQNKARRRQGEQAEGTRAATWPTFRQLVNNKAILDELFNALHYGHKKFKTAEWRLIVMFQLIYSFLIHNADIMAPRFQVFYDTELVLITNWPPIEPDNDKNYLFVHSNSSQALLSMGTFKTSKSMGRVRVKLSPSFAREALLNLKFWPRTGFFGNVADRPTQATAQAWLKKAWLVNVTGRYLNYMDLRSSLVSYFLITHEKYADKEQYAYNSMTSIFHMELDYRKVGLPAYNSMKGDLEEARRSGSRVEPDFDLVHSITSDILKNGKLSTWIVRT